MSHFSVLVIGDGVESILAPYDENLSFPREVIGPLREEDRQNFMSYYKQRIPDASFDELYRKFGGEWNNNDWMFDPIKKEWLETSTSNPNARWDWWVIGGRWPNRLVLKDGTCTNQALMQDIDWDAVRKNSEVYAGATRFWELKVEGAKPETDEERELLARSFYTAEYYTNRYQNKETFATATSTFSTHAIVTCTDWHESGEMGWWGVSSETPEEALDWELNMFERYIKDLPPDTLLTVVDCHI